VASASTSGFTQTLAQLGFKPVDPWGLLSHITSTFGSLIAVVFSWVYFLSEMGVLVGALVYLTGSIGSHSRIKRVGMHIVLYAILGFLAAVILPGVIVSINNSFHG